MSNDNSGTILPASLRMVSTSRVQVSSEDTIAEIIQRSGRRSGGVPLRRTFVQGGPQQAPVPGPLASFVRAHDERGLDLYLLVPARPSHGPGRADLASRVWGRALGLGEGKSAMTTVSRTFRRLEEHGLIDRSRS